MSHRRRWASLLAMAVGCAQAPTSDVARSPGDEADAWWQLPATDDDPTDSGAADDGRAEDYEALLWGELYDEGDQFDGRGGVKVRRDGDELCVVDFGLPQTGAAEGCEACAVQLAVTPTDVHTTADEGCAALGIDPSTLDAIPWALGFAGEELWMQQESGWATAGVAEPVEGGWWFHIQLDE